MFTKTVTLSAVLAATSLLGAGLTPGLAQTQAKSSSIDIALIGEPGPIEPTAVTADLISIIGQHIYETLYAFDKDWKVEPLLASAMPKISKDGLTYSIPLRTDVTFHDNTKMKPADVVASLQRWLDISPRGKLAASDIDSVKADGDSGITIKLKKPFAPLMPLLSYMNAAAVIMPADIAKTSGPLKKNIGTGPYKLVEHRPDQYILMKRFKNYKPASGKPSRYAGKHDAKIDELRFIPVPNANTRVDGVISGQYDFADSLPAEMLPRIKSASKVSPVIVKPFASPYMFLNESSGPMANQTIRQAVQAAISPKDMMLAAFGDKSFFSLEGSIYPKGTPYYDESSAKLYNQADAKKAAALLKKAGYNGEPIRILTSQQYDFLYRMSVVAQANLQQAGFKVDLQVLDWATLLQKRADKKSWDAFFTYINFVPEPALLTFMNPSYPGWWDSPEKQAAAKAFNTDTDPAARVQDWKKLQKLFYTQVPTIKIGDFFNLAAKSKKLENYQTTNWPYFWNVTLDK